MYVGERRLAFYVSSRYRFENFGIAGEDNGKKGRPHFKIDRLPSVDFVTW
jgi:hypothetical protein